MRCVQTVYPMLGMSLLCCMALNLCAAPARALDADLENAYLKIIAADSKHPDPNTYDNDGNGIVNRAEMRMLDTVLRDNDAPQHTFITTVYTLNHLQIQRDNTLGAKCALLQLIYGFTCDDYERFAAAVFTIGEPAAIDKIVNGLAAQAGVKIDPKNYNITAGIYLRANGDLDSDSFTNLQEYTAVCGNFDNYVQAAMDPHLNPITLPCCANCPLTISQQPVGAAKYTGDTVTFAVAVINNEGAPHYQWYKDNTPLGQDADSLALDALTPDDAGQYWCVVSDTSETVTSNKVTLIVDDHMQITQQPVGATRNQGDNYTFIVSVAGGIGKLNYQWRQNGAAVGGDVPHLIYPVLDPTDAGLYHCEISDQNETIISDQVQLIVLPAAEGEGEGEAEGATEGEGEGEGEGATEGATEGEGEGQAEGATESEGHLQVVPVSGTTLDFNRTLVSRSSEQAITVNNTGNGPLVLHAGIENGPVFTVKEGPDLSLAAGASVTLHVVFKPTDAEPCNDVLILQAGDDYATYALTGTGVYIPFLSCHGGEPAPPAFPWGDLILLGVVPVWLAFQVRRQSLRGTGGPR